MGYDTKRNDAPQVRQAAHGTLVVVRIRRGVGKRGTIEDTMAMLGLKRKHTLVILPRTDSIVGMVKKAESCLAWGELDNELKAALGERKRMHLKPPLKGFRSLSRRYPKGDVGYWGKDIGILVKKMML
ncbi:MAG: uL30 family ribosomal protein [Candidatus Aenigmarchaeota archaeon]|nr:uL30 family ribosomal protein [Candidatus Aenigmarchaeota archaeon]